MRPTTTNVETFLGRKAPARPVAPDGPWGWAGLSPGPTGRSLPGPPFVRAEIEPLKVRPTPHRSTREQ
jgi:hypothetical protein